MKLHAKPLPKLSVLALCLVSACMLSACGGGELVRASPPPQAPPTPPPPPPPPPQKFCPPPLTGDCIVNPLYTLTFDENAMTGGRQSDYALIMRSEEGGWLTLFDENRFSGGTTVERGTLILGLYSTLISNTSVSPTGEFWLGGTLRGDLSNNGRVLTGQIRLSPNNWAAENSSLIEGNYRQSATATLVFTLDWPLQITGQAQLDGGTAELRARQDYSGTGYVYYLPTTPSSQWLLHANGGVVGQFGNWTSPGLFIEGSLRYTPNDVFFDLTRISLLTTMAANAKGDATTLHAAGNVDNAFLAADTYATSSAAMLTPTQRQFLQSAASLQNIRDYDQAVTTFDSLSGHGHVAAVDALLQQATRSGARSSAHLGALQPGVRAGAWSAQPVGAAAGDGTFTQARTTGYDQWLNDRLVLGSSVGSAQGNLQFDRTGGSARSQSPQWNLYLRGYGDNGVYAMGEVGYGHHQLNLDRSIDLGFGKQSVHSRRNLDVTHAYAEAGRDMHIGNGRLTPFAALSYAALRDDGFIEQGTTGFELIAQPSLHQRLSSDAGLRYARDWRWGTDRWVRFDLGAQYRFPLGASNDMRAAFTGTPGAGFDLRGLSHGDEGSAWQMNLAGGSRDRWSWSLSYDQRSSNRVASLGFEVGF